MKTLSPLSLPLAGGLLLAGLIGGCAAPATDAVATNTGESSAAPATAPVEAPVAEAMTVEAYDKGYGEIAEKSLAAGRAFAAGLKPMAGDEDVVLGKQGENCRTYAQALSEAALAMGKMKPPAEREAAHKATVDALMGVASYQGRCAAAFAKKDMAAFQSETAAFRKEMPEKLLAMKGATKGMPPMFPMVAPGEAAPGETPPASGSSSTGM